jgi:CBS domain containing-hemolysin-like protein
MSLLIFYFSVAIGVSFLCSILESVLLSVNMAFIALLEKDKPKAGRLLKCHKRNINKSISAILILNTFAHTLGAAGVGAQAEVIFGSSVVFYVSVVLTFAILFFSEIIPKTIGAVYWKELAPISAYLIQAFVWLTYPIIVATLFITDRISKDKEGINTLSKQELLETALISEEEGAIDEQESDVIENILSLDDIKVRDILTPRSVVFALKGSQCIHEIASKENVFQFSRIPIYKDDIDHVTGIVLTKNIFQQMLKNDAIPLDEIKRDIFKVNENIPVSVALNLFIKKKEHMFLVVDGYDQTEGIITLEDCVETLLGVEIMDESDNIEDMREYAKQRMRQNRKPNNKNK